MKHPTTVKTEIRLDKGEKVLPNEHRAELALQLSSLIELSKWPVKITETQ
jgi:hypothetical protein